MYVLYHKYNKCRFVAGAACPKEIVNFMDSVGIPVCEGYGKSTICSYLDTAIPYSVKGFCVSVHSTSFIDIILIYTHLYFSAYQQD